LLVNAETKTSVVLADEDDVKRPTTGSPFNSDVTFHFVYLSVNGFKAIEWVLSERLTG